MTTPIDVNRLKAKLLGPTGNGADAKAAPPRSANGKASMPTIKTAAALRTMTFPPLKFVVPGLLPEGLVILAGKPKVRKSWLALDIALAVADGRFCLGDRKCQQGSVLYLALEDGERRIQRRITKLLPSFGGEWPKKFHYATNWPRIDQEGVEQIDAWVELHPDARVVVVDIFARLRAPSRAGIGAYEQDYAALLKLQQLAVRRGITVIVVHHTRKGDSEDPVEEVSGTLGLSGCADGFLVLKRTAAGATLTGRGRDIEDVDLAVQFSDETCRWTILGAAAEVQRSDQRTRVLAALADAKDGMSPVDLSAELGISHTNAKVILFRMAKAGEIKKVRHGRYACNFCNPCNHVKNDNPLNEITGDSDRVTAVTGVQGWHPPQLSESSGDDAVEFLKSTGWKA
jgi:AAA domain